MMTPDLCKAARAFLHWQQADLANAARLSAATINNFERGASALRSATRGAIKAAFEAHGIEFLGESGLRKTEDITAVSRFAGQDFIEKMNEDIYATLRKAGSEFLSLATDESLWRAKGVQQANEAFNAWRARLGIKSRILCPKGAQAFNAPRQSYRFLDPESIGSLTYNIYGDRVAFILWKKRQIVILRNALIADTFRRQFFELWRRARP